MLRIRRYSALASLIAAPTVTYSQTSVAARSEDVTTIDGIIAALYATISGPVGQPRDWDRFSTLFQPEARLIPTRCPVTGQCTLRVLTPLDYRRNGDSALVALGFREVELVRHTERFGAIAHAFSSYASYRGSEITPFSRGINSIQLFHDGSRWWVLSIYWDSERASNPLPPAFVPPGVVPPQ